MTPYRRSTKSSGRLSRSTARMLRASVIKQLRCTQPQPQSQPHNHTQPEHRHNSGQPTLRSLAREQRRAHRVCRLSATSSWSHNTSSSSTWRRRYAVTMRRWRACASACCLSYMMAHSRRLTRVVTHRHTHKHTHTQCWITAIATRRDALSASPAKAMARSTSRDALCDVSTPCHVVLLAAPTTLVCRSLLRMDLAHRMRNDGGQHRGDGNNRAGA